MLRVGKWVLRFSTFPLAQAHWQWVPSLTVLKLAGWHWVSGNAYRSFSTEIRDYRWLCFAVYAFGPRVYA